MDIKGLDPVYLETFPGTPRKGDLKRFEIISKAIELLAEEGPGLSFDHIAKAMNTRRSHISYYFKTREELLGAILKYITATAQSLTIEQIKGARSVRERVLAMADGALDWAQKHPAQAKSLLLFYFIFSYSPKFKKLHTAIRMTGLKRFENLLAALFENQPKPYDFALTARGLQAMITGMLVEMTTIEHGEDYRPMLYKLCLQLLHVSEEVPTSRS